MLSLQYSFDIEIWIMRNLQYSFDIENWNGKIFDSQKLAEEILGENDNNHDAVLTFDEFIPWCITTKRNCRRLVIVPLKCRRLVICFISKTWCLAVCAQVQKNGWTAFQGCKDVEENSKQRTESVHVLFQYWNLQGNIQTAWSKKIGFSWRKYADTSSRGSVFFVAQPFCCQQCFISIRDQCIVDLIAWLFKYGTKM